MRRFGAVLTVAALALGLAAGGALAAEQAGRVTDVLGEADVLRADSGARERLRTFSPLFQGDKLETGADGRVKVLFVDDSVISLAPDSALVITDMLYAAQRQERRGMLSLLRGRVRALVARYTTAMKSQYQIATPTAVAGIRGTTLTVGTGLDTNDYVALEEGDVQWCMGDSCMVIPAGAIAFIQPDGTFVPPQQLTGADVNQYIKPAAFGNVPPPPSEGGKFDFDPQLMRRIRQFRGGRFAPPRGSEINTDERNVPLNPMGTYRLINLNLILPGR